MFKWFADWVVFDLLGMSVDGRIGGAIHFFLYDTTKIFALLIGMVFLISFFRSFFPVEKVKVWLQGKREWYGRIFAAFLGVLSPFCSCSTVPLFIGFVEAGIPISITFTFLISSPIVNEISLVMLFSIFGWKIALLYVLVGMILAIVSGIIIGHLNMESYIESYVFEIAMGETEIEELAMNDRLQFAKENVIDIVKKIWPYLLVGIGIGAVIHGYAPENALVKYAGEGNYFAVPIATVLGVPLYSNAVGSLPIIDALLQKGVAPGTALAFMMAITALSFPEMVLLRKVIKPKLIGVFVLVVTIGIMLMGYGFNIIL